MRISRHQLWMDMAEVLTRRSTCYRGNVGAIIVKEKDILSCGYNGPPAGEEHCLGNECPTYSENGGCMKSDHAEKNAIGRALGKLRKADLGDCIMYCTSAPCLECAQRIEMSRIRCFIYRNSYRNQEGLNFLRGAAYVLVYRLTPSGYLINEKTGMLEDA